MLCVYMQIVATTAVIRTHTLAVLVGLDPKVHVFLSDREGWRQGVCRRLSSQR